MQNIDTTPLLNPSSSVINYFYYQNDEIVPTIVQPNMTSHIDTDGSAHTFDLSIQVCPPGRILQKAL